MIEALRKDLRKHLAHRTVNVIVRIASAVFKSAIRRGECALNPCDRLERDFEAARELTNGESDCNDDAVNPDEILNPDEIRKLLDHTTPGLYRTLFTTAAATGCRSGELFALPWSNIEMDAGFIYIKRTVSWATVKGEERRPRYYRPKTEAGKRRIPIPTQLIAVLKEWKLACPPSEDDLVFPARDGRPLRRWNVLECGLHPTLRRAGLRRVNMHSLRHSFASAHIMNGTPITELQHLLGHSDSAITLRVYSHWFKGVETDAMQLLGDLLLGQGGQNVAISARRAKVVRMPVAREAQRSVR
jgi:integrase